MLFEDEVSMGSGEQAMDDMLLKSSKGGSKFNAEIADPFDDKESLGLSSNQIRRGSIEEHDQFMDINIDQQYGRQESQEINIDI